MKRLSLFLLSLCIFFSPLFHSCSSGMKKYTAYSFDVFDTVTTVIGYANSKTEFDRISETIFRELEEYHRLFTIYEKDDVFSNLHTINSLIDGEHPAVSVDARIIDMLLYAKEMYDLTEGKVNIAMGSVLSIWHTYREEGLQSPEHAKLPSPQDLKDAAEHCRIEDVMIDEKNGIVQLADPGMTLDVGAIAKGYAVEMIAGELEKNGVSGYIINVGGNVRTIGSKPDGQAWMVGIENPQNTEKDYIAHCKLAGNSLVTSGSYQRYYTVDGKNYCHIINPDTLMPAEYFSAVSIIIDHSGMADALSTALFNMTYEEGLALINSIEGAEAIWVYPDGTLKYSDNFEQFVVEE